MHAKTRNLDKKTVRNLFKFTRKMGFPCRFSSILPLKWDGCTIHCNITRWFTWLLKPVSRLARVDDSTGSTILVHSDLARQAFPLHATSTSSKNMSEISQKCIQCHLPWNCQEAEGQFWKFSNFSPCLSPCLHVYHKSSLVATPLMPSPRK